MFIAICHQDKSSAVELKADFVTGSMTKNGLRQPLASYYQAKFTKAIIPINSSVKFDTSANQRANSQVNLVWFNGGMMKIIPNQIFQAFPNLAYVDIENVGLDEIRPEFFTNATYLKVLVITLNPFTSLGPQIFGDAKNLEFINFRFNKITSIDINTFKGLNLLGLSLESNQITTLNENIFVNIPNILILHLQSNTITGLHYGTFSGLTKMQELDLTKNTCIDKKFSILNGDLKYLDMEIFTLCHDYFLQKDLEEVKNFAGKAEQSINEVSNMTLKRHEQTETNIIELLGLKVVPMNDQLTTLRGQIMDVQNVDSTAMNKEKEISQSIVNWKISDDSQMEAYSKNFKILLQETRVKIAKNGEIFNKSLETFKMSKISDSLLASFAKLKEDYGAIQSKANAEIKSLRTCVIILFVALLVITFGVVGFVWKRIMPTNFYQKYNENVSSL